MSETLGALPKRQSSKDDYEKTRALKVRSLKGKRRIEYENGKGDNAAAVVVWTIQDEISFRESAALYVLSEVLEDRIREHVRQEMGATYAPSVSYVTFPAYDTLRHIRADVDCLKQDADALLDVVLDIASELSRSEIDNTELKAAVAPMEEGIHQAWRDNGYLLENVLYGAQEYPGIVANALRYKDGILSTITPKEIHDVAKRYLVSDDALAVSIVPAIQSQLAETPDAGAEPLKAGATSR